MKYFLDTEFMESGPGEPIHLISIGIVAESGEEYYGENANAPLEKANEWVKANVVPYLHQNQEWDRYDLDSIRCHIVNLVGDDPAPEFWGYYADYDWVVFCQIFGTMVDLPKGGWQCEDCGARAEDPQGNVFPACVDCRSGNLKKHARFPMYCNDLKQWAVMLGNPKLPQPVEYAHCSACQQTFKMPDSTFSSHCGTPGSSSLLSEHHALADARWNRQAWDFLADYASRANSNR
jgi:hypothetical protein